MNITVILAHPDRSSFNHAIARTVVKQLENNGYYIFFHDLYAENFDPLLLTVEIPKEANLPEMLKIHCDEIRQADGIVVIHPNWWGQPPAILKGWIDRVIRPGTAYEFLEGDSGGGTPRGMLNAKAAVVINTSNTESGREQSVFGDPLETIWRNCVFGLCGVENFHRRMFSVVITSTENERKQWLGKVSELIDGIFPASSLAEFVIS